MQQLPLLDIKIVFVPVTNYSETLLRLSGGVNEAYYAGKCLRSIGLKWFYVIILLQKWYLLY
jgi:hypothetical protein